MSTLKEELETGQKESGKQPRILIAEDNLVNQKLMSLIFSKLNLVPDLVSNGSEAVEAVVNNEYDIVLMDIQMPQMDGIQACARIKEVLGEEAPVIVALTANAMRGDREKFMDCGMDHYLSKPVSFEDIKLTLQQYVGK